MRHVGIHAAVPPGSCVGLLLHFVFREPLNPQRGKMTPASLLTPGAIDRLDTARVESAANYCVAATASQVGSWTVDVDVDVDWMDEVLRSRALRPGVGWRSWTRRLLAHAASQLPANLAPKLPPAGHHSVHQSGLAQQRFAARFPRRRSVARCCAMPLSRHTVDSTHPRTVPRDRQAPGMHRALPGRAPEGPT
jgi:hypothetical protein